MGFKKVCEYCNEEILDKEKFVALETWDKGKQTEVGYYHFVCFVKNHDDKVREKAKQIVQNMQSRALGLFNNLKESMGSFSGMSQLGGMLSYDLDANETNKIIEDNKNFAEKIVEDVKNEEGKKSGRKNR